MRRYLLPLVLFSAIAAVIVIVLNSDDGTRKSTREPDAENTKERVEKEAPTDPGSVAKRNTPTPLERHRWLSELERALMRDDLSNAYWFRSKVSEDIDSILADKQLYDNLMSAIRKYAIDTDDLERRKLLLPLLRVIDTDEAMALIEQEYYKALNDEERIFLLQAMADPHHSPQTAVPWIVDMALNSTDENHRQLALDAVWKLQSHYDVVYEASRQILEGSTRPNQRIMAIEAVGRSATESMGARDFIRERLKRPNDEELETFLVSMDGWGSLEDAERIRAMAREYPAHAEIFIEHATRMRRHRLAEMGKDPFDDEPERNRKGPAEETPPDDNAPGDTPPDE